MRTIIAIVLGVFIAQTLTAQTDTLIIKLNDFGQMLVVSPNFNNEKQKEMGIDKAFRKFYTDFTKINSSAFGDKNYLIKYIENNNDQKTRQISVKEIDDQSEVYFFQDGIQESLPSYKFQLTLNLSREVHIYLDSLQYFEKVNSINLDSLYTQSLLYVQSQQLRKWRHYKIFYTSVNNQINKSSAFIKEDKAFGYISLFPSFGMWVINSTFAPEVTINADFAFSKKGPVSQRFGFSTSFLFMPDENDFFDVNTYNFVNACYYLKFNEKWSHKVSIGYMIAGDGDDFSKKTWNAYWQTNVKELGIRLGTFYTKNTEGSSVFLPSIGFDFGF